MIRQAGEANRHNKTYQVWQQNNHPVVLDTKEKTKQWLPYAGPSCKLEPVQWYMLKTYLLALRWFGATRAIHSNSCHS